jgi:1,4-dihydroxy-2-naphthoate octaprenyltransferase
MTGIEGEDRSQSRAGLWVRELRLYALSASATPVLIALGLARANHLPTPAWAVASVLATAVLLHLGTNLINDAADFWKGVDRPGTTAGSGLLTSGRLDATTVYRVGVGLLLAAAVVGIPVIVARGWPVIALGLVGAAGGYAYTAGPSYKYRGLGDLGVFLLMGPILVDSSFYAITGQADLALLGKVTLASLPVAFLVAAILAANNYRDFDDDAAAGILTLAHCLGWRGARFYTISLFAAALGASVLLVLSRVVPPTTAAAIVAFVPAWTVVQDLARRSARECGSRQVVERTAKVHAMYGGLCFAGLMIASVL